ncbi:MAG: hypothetical protein BGO41_11640 [Clostridiales bacterium 38-18]|nr:MAG: hypothetical protein BGO41_11640 [Clostridiales bacterium 38-18]
MYEIIATVTKYALTFTIYWFIFRIAKLIYQDIKTMTVWESAKVTNPHLKLLSTLEGNDKQTVTEIFPLITGTTLVGRGIEAQIIIADPHISSKHLQIENTVNGYVIRDLASANGTFLNGEKLMKPLILKEGDEISLGVSKMIFSEGRE